MAQCEVHTYRASGPGGQKRNKTDSAVRLYHPPTDQTVVATESRSQIENRARALRRLRRAIALGVREPIDVVRYTPGAVLASCLTTGRLSVGAKDARFDRALAEVLDLLIGCGGSVSKAAQKLGVSTANLVSFFGSHPKVWARVNQMRAAEGLRPLRKE